MSDNIPGPTRFLEIAYSFWNTYISSHEPIQI